ncbi:MAG: hypothetical protein H8E44_45145 [Planctomycetes bacterium]|nr:hypothetical protein [Planctomycetota bacterium]
MRYMMMQWTILRLALVVLTIGCCALSWAAGPALKLSTAEDVETSAGFPITTGVPFAREALSPDDLSRLAVVDGNGDPVPAQFTVRGVYPNTGHVRWVGVDFAAVPGAGGYRLNILDRPARASDIAKPVVIEETRDAYIVLTGDLRAEIPRAGAMLRRVSLGKTVVLEQGAGDGNWLVNHDGTRYSESNDKSVRATVELKGPLHSVICVDGRYVDDEGNPSCRWTARLHFYAGQPMIGITHTFTWIGKVDQLKIRDLAISFGLKTPATIAIADKSSAFVTDGVSVPIEGAGSLSLLQDTHWHFGHGENHFGVYRGTPGDGPALVEGEEAGNWIAAGNDTAGVTLVMRRLWQQFPKQLRAEPNRLTAYLWTADGKSGPMDLTFDGMDRFTGPHFAREYADKWKESHQRYRDRPECNDPTGMAKTHDLLLVFNAGEPQAGDCAKIADAFEEPPLVLPDPTWTMESGVVGPLWPVDRERFPEMEEWIDRVWGDVWACQDEWGDYGFVYYGEGPHQNIYFVDDKPVATVWRYTSGVEYGVSKAGWLGYLRSGDRRFYNYSVARTRYMNDAVLCHEESPSRLKGTWEWHTKYPIPWIAGPNGLRSGGGQGRSFGFFIEHALLHYYLTGDERSMDVVRTYADALKTYITARPDYAKETAAMMYSSATRWYWQRVDELATLYEALGDEWFLDQSKEFAKWSLDPNSTSGFKSEVGRYTQKTAYYPTYIFYRGPHVISHTRNLTGNELDDVNRSIVAMAEHQLRTNDLENRTIGLRMAYAHDISKNPRFLGYALKRLKEHRFERSLPPTGSRPYTTRMQTAGAYNAIVNQAYLMSALASVDQQPDWDFVLFKVRGAPAATAVLLKPEGKPLVIEVAASPGVTFRGPAGDRLPKEWLGEPLVYYPHNDRYPDVWAVNEQLLYQTITIPADSPEGEYRINADEMQTIYVLSTTATGAVLLAPDGFEPGKALDAPQYFMVPDDARRFRFAFNMGLGNANTKMLSVFDPAGKEVTPKATDKDIYEVNVPAGSDGKLWSIRSFAEARHSPRLRLADVVPAITYRKPELHFLPKDAEPVETAKP